MHPAPHLDAYRRIMDVMHDPVLLVTSDGLVACVNRRARELIGRDAYGPIGQILSDTDEKIAGYLRLCSRTRDSVPALLTLRTPTGATTLRCDGALVEPRTDAAPALLLLKLRPKARGVERFLLLNEKLAQLTREIQRRQQIENALRASETRFRELADAMPQIVWTARPDGRPDYYNRRWYEIAGTNPKDDEEGWISVLHPDDAQPTRDAWYESVRTGTEYDVEYRLRDGVRGGYRWHLGRGVPVRDASGAIVRWYGTSTDIDDQKKFEQELERQAEELRRSNADLEDFAYIASHDLKEPLRGISTFAALLREDHGPDLSEEAQRKLLTVETLSKRMYMLLDSLLEYSRVGRGELLLKPTDLGAVVAQVIETLQPRLSQGGAQVTVGELPRVRCDNVLITQVFTNLITNAIKYNCSDPKHIEIGVTPGEPRAIFVRDNGIGIPPQHLSAIFRIFKRLHQRNDYGGGAGVGLSIVKKIVERHGGRIWAESSGGGTTFYFTLPPAPHSISALNVERQLPAGLACK